MEAAYLCPALGHNILEQLDGEVEVEGAIADGPDKLAALPRCHTQAHTRMLSASVLLYRLTPAHRPPVARVPVDHLPGPPPLPLPPLPPPRPRASGVRTYSRP